MIHISTFIFKKGAAGSSGAAGNECIKTLKNWQLQRSIVTNKF